MAEEIEQADIISVTKATPEQMAAAQAAGDAYVKQFQADQAAGEGKGTPSETGTAGGGQRELPCPFCTGKVLTKKAGRLFLTIAGFLQRSFSIRIPTEFLTWLSENTPVQKQAICKEKCKFC